MNRHLIYALLIVFAAPFPFVSTAFAQNCEVQYEALVNLRSPFVGSYNIWDTVYGEVKTDEAFNTGYVLESGNLFVVGTRIDPDKGDKKSLLMAEIGRNGRVFWEKQHEIAALGEIVTVLPHKKGAVVLANITPESKRKHIWLGFFDDKGGLVWQKTIKGGNGDLIAHDIERSKSGKSFVVAAFSITPGSGQPGWSVVYRVNTKGAVMTKQSFVIGAENAIHDLHRLENGDFMAVGTIDDAGGRETGWMMRLAEDLRMVWQKPYPRGAAAELIKGHSTIDGVFVTTGTALPVGNGTRATWVMAVDENSGDIGWQRYFSGDLHFDARDIWANGDGMITVLMDGQTPEDSDVTEHVRLLTINPRGVLFVSDEFFNGAGVDAYRLLPNEHGERLVIGRTIIDHQIEEDFEGKPLGPMPEGQELPPDETFLLRSSEGWVIAFTAVDGYEDPCKPKMRTLQDGG